MNLYLIDATYELFRSFYGYPKRLTGDGREVGAVRGLMEHVVLSLIHISEPTRPY